MKKTLIFIVTILLSATLGYWINEMNRFATGVVEDAKQRKHIRTDSIVYVSDGEQFQKFIWRFMNDSAFQFERIKFPLEAELTTEDFDTDYVQLEPTEWEMSGIFTEEEYRIQIYDNWQEKLDKSNQRLIVYHGIDNGIRIEYHFELLTGKWFLIKFADHST